MKPFIDKIYAIQKDQKERLPEEGEWSWLREWKSPIDDEKLEVVSEQGKKDATVSHAAGGSGAIAEGK